MTNVTQLEGTPEARGASSALESLALTSARLTSQPLLLRGSGEWPPMTQAQRAHPESPIPRARDFGGPAPRAAVLRWCPHSLRSGS